MASGIASVASFNALFSVPAIAQETKKQGKKCILLWLCGAPSQCDWNFDSRYSNQPVDAPLCDDHA
jgi:hypothetical protein